ncbi:hypothetical protein GT348_08545 [Aristophania vespae]|uniref:Uncharacterized protein n=1 Tax=Aristophania vespae TaxID=2697033 RepID=A0A6P1NC62_9PROT|nr:hypothetical protein [Aristophania vespae]QHI96265.1 hypothetical protein GT348_08545 [Aristophania vespae]UMM64071.1 hypothetical protein DM15PD_10540 [Aristophania vespae]
MQDASTLTRLWLIDWFGHIIGHDPIRDELIRQPFTSGEYPDLFLLASVPLQLPATAVLRKRSSLPRSLPELEMVDAKNNLIGLRVKDRDTWFSVNPRNELTHFNSAALMGWEMFAPLTLEMLNGLSALIDRKVATVSDSSGQEVAPLTFKPEGDNIARLGDFSFMIGQNLNVLRTIGEMSPDSTLKVTFKPAEGSTGSASFTIKRLASAS